VTIFPRPATRLESTEGRGPVVAIIGGGASGTLAAVHLLRAAAAQHCPLRIAIIDRHGRHGLGQAYATSHPDHLLNAPAGRMSALAGQPDHLTRWAATAGLAGFDAPGAKRRPEGSGGPLPQRRRRGAPRTGVPPEPALPGGSGGSSPRASTASQEFLPRQAYGRYLRDLLADAERQAQPLSRVARLTADVAAIRPGPAGRPLRLVLAGDCLDADLAVLATGHPSPRPPVPLPDSPRCVLDPWAPGALAPVRDGSPVVILGTGLTMLDVAMAVTSGPNRTVVHAVSRHGLLPQVHRGLPAPGSEAIWLPVLSDSTGPVRLSDLLWQVRTAMASRPQHWQDVLDALRPHLPGLWQRLPVADQRMFLRHVARYWEVHRHRMAPATAQHITRLRRTGQLTMRPGRVSEVTERDGLLRVRVDQDGSTAELTAGWLVNGTGPGTDITATTDPLLRDLLGRGLARPDPHRLGIDADPAGAVLDAAGTPSRSLFTLGPTLRGLRYETTAIPEIRDQAAALATQLTAAIAARYRPGSAA
jgi:uncharacterized NAD(P)/FAD-binding protein YdhS